MELQTINQVSKAYGISTRMLRYYEEIGLINSTRINDYAYRVYDETALFRLQQIIVLRKLRVPMKHIGVILENPQTTETLNILKQNIREFDNEIQTLSTIRDILIRLYNELESNENIRMNYALLKDSSVRSVIDSLSLPKNLVKESTAMNDFKNEKSKTIPFGKYNWRVLEEKDDKILILSEYTIESRSYHHDLTDVTWETCDMRNYLNNDFFDTFTSEEKARILETKISDRDNPWYGTKCGNHTIDKIFLLSYDEVIKYFGDSGDYKNRQGWNWTEVDGLDGGVAVKGGLEFVNDQYNNARKAYKEDGSISWWWLRSPGGQGRHTTGSIGFIGEIFLCGDDVWMYGRENGAEENGGVRPAMWVKGAINDV